jgi:hypothetical protein
MLAARSLPALAQPRSRASSGRRAAITVAAAVAPVTTTTLPDGRKVEVYPTTADAAAAVAASFVTAYKQVRLPPPRARMLRCAASAPQRFSTACAAPFAAALRSSVAAGPARAVGRPGAMGETVRFC